jgi:uncharacterized membrane protein YdbT with pleckstrin-like domain
MSYVKSVLQADEQIRYVTNIHWIIYVPGVALLVVAALVYGFALTEEGGRPLWIAVAGVLAVVAALTLFQAWFRRFTTEIAVTNRRIIYKRGFIRRDTIEMQMDKVESVDVQQSVGGRILGYGDILIRGVGVGIEPLKNIDSPIEFRNHVTGEQR